MIFFRSDYSQGAHPKVMKALEATNYEHTDGYGLDPHSERAAAMTKKLIGVEDCSCYMMVGGTPCNVITISAALEPYQCIIAPRSGHIYFHEAGAIEAAGHRVTAMEGVDGKLTPELIDKAFDEFEDEHTPVPAMVYISQPTESGTLYSKAELQAVYDKCRERKLLLYIDGARLGSGLTSAACDFDIHFIATHCDAFYIGGTKNGALFGEILVILNKRIDDHFRWMIKQRCGLLAKGRLIGVQFEALLEGGEDSIYFHMARHANQMAEKLRKGLADLGCEFYGKSVTNQVFPILPCSVADALEQDFFFYRWAPPKEGRLPIRLVTAWGTKEEEVDAFLQALGKHMA